MRRKAVLVCLLFLTTVSFISSCAPSYLAGEANVIRAIERGQLDKLGEMAQHESIVDVRIAAIKGFNKFPNNEKAVTYLSAVISGTRSPTIQRAAVQSLLYQLQIEEARSLVHDHLVNGTVNIKLELIDKLNKNRDIDLETRKQFVKVGLSDNNPDVRLASATQLRKIGDLSGSEAVYELLMYDFTPIRRRAAEEIVNYKTPQFQNDIANLLRNENDNIVKTYLQLALDSYDSAPQQKTVTSQPSRDTNRSVKPNIDELSKEIHKVAPKKIEKNRYLAIISIEDYLDVPDVEYAKNSGEAMLSSLQKLAGIPTENTVTFFNNEATGGRLKAKMNKFIKAIPKDAVVYIYFAGHGLPSRDGKRVYLLPYDASSEIYEDDYFEVNSFINRFAQSKPAHVFAFIDSCFSGRIDQNTMLFDGVAAITLTKKNNFDDLASNRFTVLTAAKEDQFANSYKEKEHRLFSYYIIKGMLEGKQDARQLHAYADRNVEQISKQRGGVYEQNVTLLNGTGATLF